jgi:hypothetical protein
MSRKLDWRLALAVVLIVPPYVLAIALIIQAF